MPDAAPPQKNRSRRSLLRLLGRGLAGLAVLAALAVVGFYLLAVWPDRRAAPYRQAMQRLHQNPSAARLLGQPIEAGWWIRGTAGADSARLAVPVSGPARGGLLRVEAEKAGSAWVFSRLELAVDDGNLRLSLLKEDRQRQQRNGEGGAPLEVPPRYRE